MNSAVRYCLFAFAVLGPLQPMAAAAEPQAIASATPGAPDPVVQPAVTASAPAQATMTMAAPPAPAPAHPAVTLQAKVDLGRQTMTVIERGRSVATWAISSGVEDHATPRGVFQPEWTAKLWLSRTYDNAPMPNAVFFKDGAAVHGTQAVGALGRAASHGCVRLAPANAEAFYKMVGRHGLVHTRIAVFGAPTFNRPPAVAQRAVVRPQRMIVATVERSRQDDGLLAGLIEGSRSSATYATARSGSQRPFYPPLRAR